MVEHDYYDLLGVGRGADATAEEAPAEEEVVDAEFSEVDEEPKA